MHRYELTDGQWACIAPLFPGNDSDRPPGRPWHEHRQIVNGVLWHLHTGAPWRDLPERYGPWQTVYDRFNGWRQDGTWATIVDVLLLRLDKAGLIDRDLWLIDASIIRASRAAAGVKKKSTGTAALGRTQVAASDRATRSCARPFQGRLRYESPPCLRWPRHRVGGLGHAGTTP
jgi:transposase